MTDDDERLDEDAQRIEELVVACLDAVEESGPDVVEDFCRRHPADAEVLRRRLGLLLGTGLLDEVDVAPPLPERFGAYRVTARLGGGGMGVVFCAREDELGREVAIKTIRPELMHFADTRTRFRREMSTIAKLSHPGIVPVYGSGEQDGVPWFAMELVAGATLSRVLDAVDGRDPATLTGEDLRAALATAANAEVDADAPQFHGGWVEACLKIAREVAVALDHAHRAGVLHRDVKPSNVLLGLDGRARLFDFGLARPDGGDDAIELTRTGAMVGSLPYMAGEQVRGGAVDRRTDVYGLAATLVELLTLRPPFEEREPEALRRAIQSGPPPQLAARNRALPRDLVVVLEKALAVDPADRYATAADFARDLDAVVELRPVSARPAGPFTRLQRWVRRRPATAVATASLALLLVGAPIVLLVSNARIGSALTRAEARFDDAFDSIVHLSAAVADEGLRDVPGAGPLRREVMKRSLELFDRLVQDRPDDRQVLLQRALLQRQTSAVLFELGAHEEAEQLLAKSEQFLRDWMQRDPDDALTAYDLADLLIDRSVRVDAKAAIALLEEAERLLDAGAVGGRSEADVREARRQALHNHANLLADLDQVDEAMRFAQLACDEADRLLAAAPADDPRGRLAVGASRSLLATMFLEAGQGAEADPLQAEAERVLVDLVDDDPRPPHRFTLGVLLTNTSLHEQKLGKGEEAVATAMRAAELFEGLVREQPWRTRYRLRLAMACETVGIALAAADRDAEAPPWLARSAEALDALALASPGDVDVLERRALAHHNCAAGLMELGRRADARPHSDIAVAVLQQLVDEQGGRWARTVLVWARLAQARTRLAVGEPPPTVQELAAIAGANGPPGRDLLYQFAECCADASAFASGDAQESLRRTAVAGLGQAIDAGFDEAHQLDSAAWHGFDERDDFAAARARIER